MNQCESFCRELTAIVYSGQSHEEIIPVVAQRLKDIFQAPRHVAEGYLNDFNEKLLDVFHIVTAEEMKKNRVHARLDCPGDDVSVDGVCPTTGMPCQVKVTYPESYKAGRAIGEIIQKAFKRQITAESFFQSIFEILSARTELK